MNRGNDNLCALADSLPAAIRWRYSDYEQLLRKQLKILAPPLRLVWPHTAGDVQDPNVAAPRQ